MSLDFWTWRGFLVLAVVMDLYSRKIVGWTMKMSLAREIVIDALLIVSWCRTKKNKVMVHSDQGSKCLSFDCRKFCESNDLMSSMSRRGNCRDNAVAELFFSSLKKERMRRKVYHTVEEAKADLFNYIEMFYNPSRRHGHIGKASLEGFERASSSGL